MRGNSASYNLKMSKMKKTKKDISEKKARTLEKNWGWGNFHNAGIKKFWQRVYNKRSRRVPAYTSVISEETEETDEMPITRLYLVNIENRPRHHRGDIMYDIT